LRLTDVSCFRGGTPNVWVTRLALLLVRMRLGTRAPLVSSTNWLLTLLNHTWPSEGARKPVLAAARRASAGTAWNRVATFPLTVRPKSLYCSSRPPRSSRKRSLTWLSNPAYALRLLLVRSRWVDFWTSRISWAYCSSV